MITANILRERMNAQPFQPFRICLSDGKFFDITNHDIAWVKSATVVIGVALDAKGFAENCAECSILHITRLEDIPSAKAA
jgi:hypothetical protein